MLIRLGEFIAVERRDFFKGILGACACTSAYYSYKYFQEENIKEKKTDSKTLERIEVPLTYHCNLNCAYCDHFSPIAPEYIMPTEVFEKDMKQLAKITNSKIEEITLLGGEPLLHNNLPKIFNIVRKYFPNSKIEMLTNGILLEEQPESFWESCNKNDIGIYVSHYRIGKKLFNFDNLTKIIDKYKAKVRISYPKLEFKIMSLEKKEKHNIKKRYNECYSKLWPILDNGKFYSCTTVNGVEKFFNKKFPQHSIPISQDDILDIHKISSIDEIIDFYNKPKKMCAHCSYYSVKGKEWAYSKKKAN